MDPSRYQRDKRPDRPRRGLSWPAWIGLGCGCLLLSGVLVAGGFAAFLLSMMQRSGAYQEALAEVQASPGVRQALGEPITAGWWMSGSINVTGPTGEAEIAFPVRGPEGRGKVYVDALKSAGEWSFQRLEVEIGATGERIDVLAEGNDPLSPSSEGRAPGAWSPTSTGLDRP